jgi:hypothetical protein
LAGAQDFNEFSIQKERRARHGLIAAHSEFKMAGAAWLALKSQTVAT